MLMALPAAAATVPLIQNVNKAEAKPKRTLNGRKHHIRRGWDGGVASLLPPPPPPPLLLLLLLALLDIKSYTRKMPGRGEAASEA